MDHDFINSSLLKEREPAERLFSQIMAGVSLEKQRQLSRRKLFIFSAFFGLTLLASVPVLQMFISDLNYSGFGDYLRLALTDFSSVLIYWQDWTLSILESLPALSLAALMVIVAGLLISLKNILANAKNFYKLNHLTIN
jgi:hypothetical protein